MTAALILMSSACVAGADCGGCAAPAPSCHDSCARVSILDKVKARLSMLGHRSHGCGDSCAPACHAAPACHTACVPAPTCHTACAPACHDSCKPACGTPLFSGAFLAKFKKHDCGCDPCAKPKLLDRLRARFHKSCDSDCSSGCDTGCSSGCGAAPMVAPAPAAAPAAPKVMPAPGKTTSHVVPSEIRPVGNTF